MIVTYRGSVNRWECDENDHLNVRFFVQRHWQTLQAGLETLGVSISAAQLSTLHIRFLAEARIATPLTGKFGVVTDSRGGTTVIFTQLCHSVTGQCLSSALHDVRLQLDHVPEETECTIDSDLGPRGIPETHSAFADLPYADLAAHNFQLIGKGIISGQEVTPDGSLCVHHYMGRLSDSMPHLWINLFGGTSGLDSGQGGAVLEYRMGFHRFAQLGTSYEVWSGLSRAGRKVQQFTHLMFDAGSKQLILDAQAVGLRMDLESRKSVDLPDDVYAQMKSKVLLP
ncbi:MAG: hypothetical protein AAF541_08065 [Pseudomonadota bacterium]